MAGSAHRVLLVAVVALFLAGCPHSHAVDVSVGVCPTKEVVQNFDASRYAGHWYELERYWQVFELRGKCSQAEYTLNSTGVVKVRNTMVDTTSGQERSIEGYAELADPRASPPEGKLTVVFNVPVVGERRAPYWVLDTDYDNYSLVYSCSTVLNIIKLESAWILSRTARVDDPTIQQAIESAIAKNDLARDSFLKTTQDCQPSTA